MNIVMFVDKFYPFIGGVEKHTMKISRNLVERGNKVTIITRGNKDLPTKEVYKGISIIRINFEQKNVILNIYYQIIKNIKVIFNADIIHFHDYSTFYYWFYPFRYVFFWKKYFITFHGWEGKFPPDKNVIKIRKRCEKYTKGNICVGDFIKKWYETKPNITIYGAAESDIVTKFEKEDNKILYLGRLEEDTGILKYIDILKIVKDVYKIDFKFEICGDGQLKKLVIEKLQELKIDYIYHGFIEDSTKYLRSSKICFTSGYLSIIEAMNNENVVVSLYNNDLKRDYITMMPCSNEIIANDDNMYLAKEIVKVLKDNDEYLKRVTSAKKWSKKQTWDNVVEEYLKLWNNY